MALGRRQVPHPCSKTPGSRRAQRKCHFRKEGKGALWGNARLFSRTCGTLSFLFLIPTVKPNPPIQGGWQASVKNVHRVGRALDHEGVRWILIPDLPLSAHVTWVNHFLFLSIEAAGGQKPGTRGRTPWNTNYSSFLVPPRRTVFTGRTLLHTGGESWMQ